MNTATGVTVKAVVVVAPVVAAGGAPATQIQVTSFTAANLNSLGVGATNLENICIWFCLCKRNSRQSACL